MQPTYLPILYQEGVEASVLQEISAGLEEEGVPFSCIKVEDSRQEAAMLGYQAAALSSLGVGIGVTTGGSCAICHEMLECSSPYYSEAVANGRLVGHNAARLVKGMPLKVEVR